MHYWEEEVEEVGVPIVEDSSLSPQLSASATRDGASEKRSSSSSSSSSSAAVDGGEYVADWRRTKKRKKSLRREEEGQAVASEPNEELDSIEFEGDSDEERDFGRSSDDTGATRLPVWAKRNEIVEAVKSKQVVIVAGETGSGKTTQIPQYLFECGMAARRAVKVNQDDGGARGNAELGDAPPNGEGRTMWRGGLIGITQPRRVAAMSLARRVSEERNRKLGELVGYRIRFESKTSPGTKIQFMTDGMVIRECMSDRLLSKYSVLILDEAHERSLRTEIVLGLVKTVLAKRQDLKVVLMSATLDFRAFAEFFAAETCQVIVIPGRQFKVKTFHVALPEEDFVEAAELTAAQIHLSKPPGDILVFLPGQEEIEVASRRLKAFASVAHRLAVARNAAAVTSSKDFSASSAVVHLSGLTGALREAHGVEGVEQVLELDVVPLYAALPMEEQNNAFRPAAAGTRKVILATNIAETSVTIPGIVYVVDAGKVKVRNFHPRSGVESLKTETICKSGAMQRAGRAGREREGEAYRIYTESEFEKFETCKEPEIRRCDLSQVILELKSLGIEDVKKFPFMSAPSSDAIDKAQLSLQRLGALDGKGCITKMGKQLSLLPLTPKLAKFLVESLAFGCTAEALTIAAMLSVDNVMLSPTLSTMEASARKQFLTARARLMDSESDHLSLLNAFNFWKSSPDKFTFCKTFGVNGRGILKAKSIRKQLKEVMQSQLGVQQISSVQHEPEDVQSAIVRKCIAKSFFMQVAKLDATSTSSGIADRKIPSKSQPTPRKCYLTELDRQEVYIHPKSALFGRSGKAEVIVFHELIVTTRKYVRIVSAIDPDWLVGVEQQKFRDAMTAHKKPPVASPFAAWAASSIATTTYRCGFSVR